MRSAAIPCAPARPENNGADGGLDGIHTTSTRPTPGPDLRAFERDLVLLGPPSRYLDARSGSRRAAPRSMAQMEEEGWNDYEDYSGAPPAPDARARTRSNPPSRF